jgi:hypothetical protein
MAEENSITTSGIMPSVVVTNPNVTTFTCAHCYFPGSEVRFSCGCSLHAVRLFRNSRTRDAFLREEVPMSNT